jgi:hypothetical protein
MKSLALVLSVAVMLFSPLAFAQSEGAAAAPSEGQKSFAVMKSLAGNWTGQVTLDPPMQDTTHADMEVSLRVTSRGNALVHEMRAQGTPDDPSKYDHPVTMFYLDQDQLNLVHYCDAGNRPHMTGVESLDGKDVDFTFVDLSGSNQHGHMYHATFTILDGNHHIEDWTYMMPGDKPMHAHMDLRRVQ